jgi:E3 ubiquitin-protein ligase HUWE1
VSGGGDGDDKGSSEDVDSSDDGQDCLFFSADVQTFGETVVVDLIEDGRHIAVTDSNKGEYVQLVAQHRTTSAFQTQLEALLRGFHAVVPREMVAIFDPLELELLISGLPEIDLDDLRRHTEYHGGYKSSDVVIERLWRVLCKFTKEEKALFVQFTTGSSKVPLDGFASLRGSEGVQRFNVHKAFDIRQLPTAHTCFNQLDLPEYPTEEVMREKLLLAIRECSEGFGFS